MQKSCFGIALLAFLCLLSSKHAGSEPAAFRDAFNQLEQCMLRVMMSHISFLNTPAYVRGIAEKVCAQQKSALWNELDPPRPGLTLEDNLAPTVDPTKPFVALIMKPYAEAYQILRKK